MKTNRIRTFRSLTLALTHVSFWTWLFGISVCLGGEQLHLVEIVDIAKLPKLTIDGKEPWRGGFIKRGQEVYFGGGCWSYDIEQSTLKCELPKTLTQVMLSYDGAVLFGCLYDGDIATPYYVNTVTNEKKKPRSCPWGGGANNLHPNKQAFVSSSFKQNALYNVDAIAIFPWHERIGPTFRQGTGFRNLDGFSGDGRYIVLRSHVTEVGLVDPKTLKLLPTMPELDYERDKQPDYLGDSNALIFNADISLLAGQLDAGRVALLNPLWEEDDTIRNRTYLYDRKSKRFLWRYKDLGTPIAFSANSQYLLTGGRIVDVATGNVVQDGIKGIRGKFSPDGRSLVTMDDEAFYIYTLPKGSPAVFGVVPVVK